jgi:hypothetical protein
LNHNPQRFYSNAGNVQSEHRFLQTAANYGSVDWRPLRNRPGNTQNADNLDLRFLVETLKFKTVSSLSFPIVGIHSPPLSARTVFATLSILPSPTTSMSDAEETNECLAPDDVALVRPLLDEFKSSKRGERKSVVRKGLTAVMAARDISHLRPLAQGKIIAQVKEVRFFLQFNRLSS